MRCLRKILNITRRDRIRNKEIRSVGVTSALEYVTKQQMVRTRNTHVARQYPAKGIDTQKP
jgi:hypothetical protein